MRAILFVAVSVFTIFAVPAQAAWQYTKWGMTPQQVITASKHVARAGNAEDMAAESSNDGSWTTKLEAPYNTGTFYFTAYFLFDRSDHLVNVRLKLEGGNPSEVIGSLGQRYGHPDNHTPGSDISAWRWLTATDRIEAFEIGSNLNVNYSLLHQANEKGL